MPTIDLQIPYQKHCPFGYQALILKSSPDIRLKADVPPAELNISKLSLIKNITQTSETFKTMCKPYTVTTEQAEKKQLTIRKQKQSKQSTRILILKTI